MVHRKGWLVQVQIKFLKRSEERVPSKVPAVQATLVFDTDRSHVLILYYFM